MATTVDYSEKNRRRKEGKNNGPANVRANAKQLRKMVGGAFGNLKEDFQRECLPGTLGSVSENANNKNEMKKGKKGGVSI